MSFSFFWKFQKWFTTNSTSYTLKVSWNNEGNSLFAKLPKYTVSSAIFYSKWIQTQSSLSNFSIYGPLSFKYFCDCFSIPICCVTVFSCSNFWIFYRKQNAYFLSRPNWFSLPSQNNQKTFSNRVNSARNFACKNQNGRFWNFFKVKKFVY